MSQEYIITDAPQKRRRKPASIKPIAPYTKDRKKWLATVFDRVTDKPISPEMLKSYDHALAQYHINPEPKFLNAGYTDRGKTQRRHIKMTTTKHIGKEANDWERQAILGYDPDAAPDYGFAPGDTQSLVADIVAFVKSHTIAKAAQFLKTSAPKLRGLVTGTGGRSGDALAKLLRGRLGEARERAGQAQSARNAELQELFDAVERDGLRETARRLAELIAGGETGVVEFKSTLRTNLHTGQPDEKMQLSALKTITGFLNAKGGTLLIGVSDNGEVLGLSADGFPNEDKMGLHLVNLIKDRIGDIFLPYIHPHFEEQEGVQVLAVRCELGPKAAFVKDGNQQRFFVRGGNATTELLGNSITDYVKQRYP